MPFTSSSRIEFGKVIFDGKSKILEVVNTSKKGQKVDESLVVKESPFCQSSMNEVRMLANLKHKTIIRYRGYEKQHQSQNGGVCEDKLVLFLEKAQGGDVYEQLNQFGGKFTEEVAKSLFVQMVEAVRFLHSQNIAHRDVKLENFLVMEKTVVHENDAHHHHHVNNHNTSQQGKEMEQLLKSHIKLADFEFACERTESCQRRQDRAGTESYLSPEQVRGDYCPMKSDVWALGVALYLMLCGKYPEYKVIVPSSASPSSSSASATSSASSVTSSTGYCPQSKTLRELRLPTELSPEVSELLKRILENDEQNRPSIEELRKQSWMSRHVSRRSPISSPRGDQVKRITWPHFHLPIRIH